MYFNFNQENIDDSMRRNLETCGAVIGVACMVVAVDDVFVVPVPALMKANGLFHPANNASIIANQRDDVARQLADATTGWNAIAVGAAGRPGLGLKAASEQNAINDALGNCVKRDSDCHVIAIGPFTVGPN
jgi:adenylate cyclase